MIVHENTTFREDSDCLAIICVSNPPVDFLWCFHLQVVPILADLAQILYEEDQGSESLP